MLRLTRIENINSETNKYIFETIAKIMGGESRTIVNMLHLS